MSRYFYKIIFLALFFILLYSNSNGQLNTLNDKVKAQYLFYFGKYLKWDNEKELNQFKIGFYGSDSLMYEYVKTLTKNKKIKGKPIKLLCFNTPYEITKTQILYVSRKNINDISTIYKAIEGTNTLLVSDSCKSDKHTMINFLRLSYVRMEVNERNMKKANLELPPIIAALGASYKENWEKLYDETELLLDDERIKVEQQQKEIKQKEEEIDRKKTEITTLNQDIDTKQNLLLTQKLAIEKQESNLQVLVNNIDYQKKALFIQTNALAKKIFEINQQENIINNQQGEIKNQSQVLQKQISEISIQEERIKKQRQTLNSSLEKIKQQELIMYFFYIVILLLSGLGFFIYRSYKIKKRANHQLELKNEAITRQNEEIKQQKEEIATQRDEIESQRDMATNQRDQIIEQKQEITDSIQYASRIQNALLASNEFADKVLNQYFITFKPRDIVSGDFYWFTKIENKTIVVAADCTGHGVPGAFMSMLGITFLNEIVNKQKITEPDQILNQLRKEIIKALKQGRESKSKDGMDIAIVVIVPEKNILEYAGANNPVYIVQKEIIELQNTTVIQELKPDKMPIAIYEKMAPFNKKQIGINSGDIVYLFTDGYADQFGGPKGKKFKYKQLKEYLIEIAPLSIENQKTKIEQTFNDWKGINEQVDDVLVIGVKI